MRAAAVPTALMTLALSACAVGPTYVQPDWLVAGPAAETVDEAWWQGFNDPTLTRLIEAASARNLDLRVARARLAEARANRDSVAGAGRPQLQASAAATTNRLSEHGQLPIDRIPGFARDFDLYDAAFDASWEIDLWGHTRRAVEGARAREQSAEASLHDATLSLRAEVARSYIELRAAQARLATLTLDAAAQDRVAVLTRQRFDAGEASRFDAERAEGLARGTAAQIPAVQGDVTATAYRLALLTAMPPENTDAAVLAVAPIPQPPDLIARGLQSDLLRRRPDVRAAERQLAAATADVGTATADLFPRVALVGAIGQQARTLDEVTQGSSTRFTLGPQLHWPLFDRARLRATVRAADARSDAAAARYEATVLGAFSETETAANRYARASEAFTQSRQALDAHRQALGLARERQAAGEADLIELLTAESAYASVQQAATQAEAARALQAIALYKALGGGAGQTGL